MFVEKENQESYVKAEYKKLDYTNMETQKERGKRSDTLKTIGSIFAFLVQDSISWMEVCRMQGYYTASFE